MSNETVINVDMSPKTVHLRCNWCSGEFDYTERGGQYATSTTCPWCQAKIHVPRERLRRANKHRNRATPP